jgi:AAA family ATP:ADP antiporter
MDVNSGDVPGRESPEDDAWGFLASRKVEDTTVGQENPAKPVIPAKKREAGEFRAGMGGVSLRRRAWPMAISLALVSLAGFLTEAVAATQIVSLAGPSALFVIYPLGGLGLLILALLQFKYVDARARLTVLRVAMFCYAAAFVLALIMLGAGVFPVVATGVVYLLGDQINFLIPLLIWSLAGDEFNVAEGRKIFGWIIAFTYGGQVLGLVIATFSPPILQAIDIPLPALLVIDPVICIAVGIWLPWILRDSFAAKGSAKRDTVKEAVGGAVEFLNGVPIWRTFFFGSVATFVGGMVVLLAFMVGEEQIIGSDAAELQMFFGGVMLGSLIVCLLLQIFVAERLAERIGIPGVLMILPIATVLGGLLLVAGILTDSLVLLALGLAAWFIPRWSVDENARRAALALVPDERRTRVSFLVDLFPIALGVLIAGPVAALALLFGQVWLIPAFGVLIAIGAIPLAIKVRRGWEESLLNWRLRRRKRNRSSVLDAMESD